MATQQTGKLSDDSRPWFESTAGKRLQQIEERQLVMMLPPATAGYLVQYPCPFGDLNLSKLPPRLVPLHLDSKVSTPVTPCADSHLPADLHALPFADNSLGAIVMPHSLEVEAQPERLLGEAVRALEPEGALLMSGFNPWSLFGLLRLGGKLRRQQTQVKGPWAAHFRSIARVRRELCESDLDIEQITTVFYRWPSGADPLAWGGGMMERFGPRLLPQHGGIYFVLARKRSLCATPIIYSLPSHPRRRQLLAGSPAREGLL